MYDNDFNYQLNVYTFLRDAVIGDCQIKNKKSTYLPYPKNINYNDYQEYYNYLKFSMFPSLTSQTLRAMLGLSSEGNQILEYKNIDEDFKQDFISNYYKILSECLLVGRIGVLTEIVDNNKSEFGVKNYLYNIENIIDYAINNDNQIIYAKLKQEKIGVNIESGEKKKICQYLILYLNEDGIYTQRLIDDNNQIIYTINPQYKNQTLSFIPFYIVSFENLNDGFKQSPLYDIAQYCLNIYRLDAILNRGLNSKADPTLVVSGLTMQNNDKVNLGADNLLVLQNYNSKAYYIDVERGFDALNDQIKRYEQNAQISAGKLLNNGNYSKESGESLRQRRLLSEINLKSIIRAISLQLTKILKDVALIRGDNLDEIYFKGFVNFSSKIDSIQDLVSLSSVVFQGLMSKKTYHENLKDTGLTELNYDEEKQEIENETLS